MTVNEYGECVRRGACSAPSLTAKYCSGDYNAANNWGKAGRGDHPVNCVNWRQAVEYCRWEGKRLPTEAEWEKAARSTDGRTYPWGERAPGWFTPRFGNFADLKAREKYLWMKIIEGYLDGYAATAPVGSFSQGESPYGAYDMAGNVWEWTADWYDEKYYSVASTTNPAGPTSGSKRVTRGGGWFFANTSLLRTASRRSCSPSGASNNLGFRCVRSD